MDNPMDRLRDALTTLGKGAAARIAAALEPDDLSALLDAVEEAEDAAHERGKEQGRAEAIEDDAGLLFDDWQALAAAIRRGDRDEAEYQLDRLADEVHGAPGRISLGRYGPQARAA